MLLTKENNILVGLSFKPNWRAAHTRDKINQILDTFIASDVWHHESILSWREQNDLFASGWPHHTIIAINSTKNIFTSSQGHSPYLSYMNEQPSGIALLIIFKRPSVFARGAFVCCHGAYAIMRKIPF